MWPFLASPWISSSGFARSFGDANCIRTRILRRKLKNCKRFASPTASDWKTLRKTASLMIGAQKGNLVRLDPALFTPHLFRSSRFVFIFWKSFREHASSITGLRDAFRPSERDINTYEVPMRFSSLVPLQENIYLSTSAPFNGGWSPPLFAMVPLKCFAEYSLSALGVGEKR